MIPNISEIQGAAWIESPLLAFGVAHILYGGLLGIIFYLGRSASRSFYKKQAKLLISTHILLLLYLCLCFFGLEFQRYFYDYSHFQFLPTVWALVVYLFGLWFFYAVSSNTKKAARQIRFLLPFAIPFPLFTLILDLFFSEWNPYLETATTPLFFLIFGFVLSGLIMLFFPAIIQLIWQCQPLSRENPELAERLENLCQKAHFKHAGIRVWTVMNDALTAAIIGIIPRFRYIIFTKRILKLLSPESIEAILAHEIGHSYRRHLLIYPFIIFGMTLFLSLFGFFFEGVLSPFLFFICYALLIALYLRIVFGFFSRNFERQADLHVFELGIQPKYMIDALHQVAVASGNIHLVPSWHHYSIQERIDFLNAAIRDPSTIERHHRFVKRSVIVYFVLLILFSAVSIL